MLWPKIIIFILISFNVYALSPEQKILIKNIEQYLNGIETMRAEFLQIDPSGEVSTGDLYLARPGRLRWEYHQPVPILVVVNGSLLTYYDQELKQASHSSAHNNFVGFLARKEISFNKDITVKNIVVKAGVIVLEVTQTGKNMKDRINFIFNDKPLYIKKMQIIDEMDNVTSISLSKIRRGDKFDPALFRANQLKR